MGRLNRCSHPRAFIAGIMPIIARLGIRIFPAFFRFGIGCLAHITAQGLAMFRSGFPGNPGENFLKLMWYPFQEWGRMLVGLVKRPRAQKAMAKSTDP